MANNTRLERCLILCTIARGKCQPESDIAKTKNLKRTEIFIFI